MTAPMCKFHQQTTNNFLNQLVFSTCHTATGGWGVMTATRLRN